MSHACLKTIEQRLLWVSHWMIENANPIRPKADGIKIGGYPAPLSWLGAVARQFNERPRKTLQYETPAEKFARCVAAIR